MAQSPPRVAVVIACFNDGATLPEAVTSLENQEPHELVVVDDGSDDPQTLEVLRDLEARGVRVLRQTNQGPAAARTAGLHATTAPYVRLLDADDVDAPRVVAGAGRRARRRTRRRRRLGRHRDLRRLRVVRAQRPRPRPVADHLRQRDPG